MLPKKNRADKKQVEEIFKKGVFINSTNLTFKFVLIIGNKDFLGAKNEASLPLQKPLFPRISFIAPKSVAKLAVKRNLLRRRGYAALKKYIQYFPTGCLGVFVFKKPIKSVLEIEKEIEFILNKLKR